MCKRALRRCEENGRFCFSIPIAMPVKFLTGLGVTRGKKFSLSLLSSAQKNPQSEKNKNGIHNKKNPKSRMARLYVALQHRSVASDSNQ
jgi:hypothetical protein